MIVVELEGGEYLYFSPSLISEPKASLIQLRYWFSLAKAEVSKLLSKQEFTLKRTKAEISADLVKKGTPKSGASGAENLVYLDPAYAKEVDTYQTYSYWDSLLTTVLHTIDRILSLEG
ncbi:MAG: hypothetical protein ABIM32_03645 [candidate division WOR-3 bacterium]